MRKLFLAHTYLELQLNDEALEIYTGLQEAGLSHSTYIMAQVAITHHNQRGKSTSSKMCVDAFQIFCDCAFIRNKFIMFWILFLMDPLHRFLFCSQPLIDSTVEVLVCFFYV